MTYNFLSIYTWKFYSFKVQTSFQAIRKRAFAKQSRTIKDNQLHPFYFSSKFTQKNKI